MTAPSGEPGLDPTTPLANPAPAPQPTTSPGLDSNTPIDFSALPPNVSAYIEKLRHENGGHRQKATAAEQAATEAKQRFDAMLKAAGINADGSAAPPDPEAVAAQLAQRATAAEEALWGTRVQSLIDQSAASLGASAQALLDSRSFVDSLDEIADDDPTTPEFKTALEAKIRAALSANSALRAAPAAPGRSSGDFPGGPGATQAITEEQLAAMSPGEIAAAYAAGRLKHLM